MRERWFFISLESVFVFPVFSQLIPRWRNVATGVYYALLYRDEGRQACKHRFPRARTVTQKGKLLSENLITSQGVDGDRQLSATQCFTPRTNPIAARE